MLAPPTHLASRILAITGLEATLTVQQLSGKRCRSWRALTQARRHKHHRSASHRGNNRLKPCPRGSNVMGKLDCYPNRVLAACIASGAAQPQTQDEYEQRVRATRHRRVVLSSTGGVAGFFEAPLGWSVDLEWRMFPVTVLLTTVQSVEPSVSITARSPGPEKRLPPTTTPGKCRSKTAWAPLTAQVLPSKMIAVCPARASRVPWSSVAIRH